MAKLTKEDKIKIIQLYNEGYGCGIIAKEIGIQTSRVKEIKKQYDLYGDIVLNVSHTNRKFTPELKGLSPLMYRQQSLNQLQY